MGCVPIRAAPAEISRARARVVDAARFSDEIVETLMANYLRNQKLMVGPAEAKNLIKQIGPRAIPALEIGEQRGDVALKQHCQECLAAIRGQSAGKAALATPKSAYLFYSDAISEHFPATFENAARNSLDLCPPSR